jgi:integrase
MARRKSLVPSYLLHKPTGMARVRIDGRDHYLGPYGSDESRRKYGELVAARCGGHAPDPLPAVGPQDTGPTVGEIVLTFLRHAERHYVKNGRPTSEVSSLRIAAGPLIALFGMTSARDFGPLALKAVRAAMVDRGWCRSSINQHVSRIRRIFRHAVENELTPGETLNRLKALSPLLRDRTDAVEADPVLPVPEADVNAMLPHVGRQVRDMIRLQLLCGCRPDEIVCLRPCDVTRDGEVWEYAPASHKAEHHGRQRRIFFGPRAQAILATYLDDRPAAAPCFSPVEAEAERREKQRLARKTRVQPSQVKRAEASKRRRRGRPPADAYNVASYRRAIHRGCHLAEIDRWSPNRLRHSRATDLRRQFGIEAAQTVCGHSQLSVTQIYAERDFDKARKIMAEVG